MKKATKFLVILSVLTMLVLPVFSFAQPAPGLVQCGKAYTADTTVGTIIYKKGEIRQCDFNDFMNLVDDVIKFILVYLAVPIAAIMFFYAGFKMVTSGGSTEARATAKSVFTNTALGLIYVAGAWLIIRTLLQILGYQGAWIGF